MRVIRSKVRPPSSLGQVIPRPRLTRHIAELVARHEIVWVQGTAGAGKTTAVLDATRDLDGPLAWLTLDVIDTAPGRLLTHLEAALATVVPGLPPVATDALADDIRHVEAAGLLADALDGRDVTLVLDEVERLAGAEEARAALSSFLRYAPATLHAVLISRRDVALQLGSARELGGLGRVTEQDLAFSVEEAAKALEALGLPADDAPLAVEATGGWVAGVLFDAWRSPSHPHGAGGEADPLSGYLSSEIMGQLAERERAFLITTSLLRDVTAARAEALGEPAAGEVLAALREHHLPVMFSADANELRCHPRFRAYLQQRLRERDPAAVRELHRRHGEMLRAEGHLEDAVQALLDARALDAAEEAGEAAMPEVLRRRDFAVAARWLEAFRPAVIQRSAQLTYAELVVAMEREEFVAGIAPADRLVELHRAAQRGAMNPALAGAVAMCFIHVSRLDDAYRVIEQLPPGDERDLWRFQIGVAMADDPHHYRDRPEDRDALHGFLARLDVYQGRFARLLEPHATPWAAARSSRIEALRAVGRLDEALALLNETSSSGWTASRVRQYGDIMADLGREAEAYAAARQGRELIERSGPLPMMLHYLFEAALALRLRRDTALAAEALAKVESDPTARRRLRTLEQLELWSGLMALIDDDPATAVGHLRGAVELMTTWDRLFFLPVAGVYLAEACWRLEDEGGADAAADLALAAAARQGSNHLLLQALREYPAVVSRRLDAEAGTDSAWHGLGRTLMAEGLIVAPGLRPRVVVREFGTALVVVDGEEVQPKLTRSVEVLAYLAARGGRVSRDELLEDLFGGRADDSARSYLRQALRGVADLLPADAGLEVGPDEVAWEHETLTSESMDFQRAVQEAQHQSGRARLDALEGALAITAAGDYLPAARSGWVDGRREELRSVADDARVGAAEAAFELGELQVAESHVQVVLRRDQYRESAWRLSMRIAGAMGDDDRVIARFRACRDALAELSVAPADSTRELLERLRR